MALKRTPADIAFSKCIREAANWTCERCGTSYPKNAPGLECSHHHTRGAWSIRFHPLNAEALCTGCHFLTGGTEERRNEVITEDDQILLYRMKNDTALGKFMRKTKGKGEIAKYYRNILTCLENERDKGNFDKLQFEAWQEREK